MTSARQCPALNGAARGRLAGPGGADVYVVVVSGR